MSIEAHKKHLEYMRLLDGRAMKSISHLELIARGMVEGFVTGKHRSPYRGFSVEFAEHREYVAGDDVKDIDWRVYAKSDRYYVKQYMEETNLRASIILDASGSMAYTGNSAIKRDGLPLSKFDYATRLAALLTHLLLHQQDAVGLVTFDTRLRKYIPSRSRQTHMQVLLEELSITKTGGETNIAPILHDIAERIKKRGLIIIISDFFDDPEEVLKGLHHFRYRKHEVILMHVMAEEELSFPFDNWSMFKDLEVRDAKVEIDPRAIRAAYLDEIRRFIDVISKGAGDLDIDYVPMITNTELDQSLSGYLSHRQRLRK